MSQDSLNLIPEHTISANEIEKFQKDIDEARSHLHNAAKLLTEAKSANLNAEENWKKACLALPSVIYHTDTKIYELIEKTV